MQKFKVLRAVAAPLNRIDVNTDIILPARYLKVIGRTGLGRAAFQSLRYDEGGAENPQFILNQPGYREAEILIAGRNFGCGSSREHAPWALRDFGLRCIIAPSFADIFYQNCFKNGMLCITLPQSQVDTLMRQAAPRQGDTHVFEVDLPRQVITLPDGSIVEFAMEPAKKNRLLLGLDDIDETLRHSAEIATYEGMRGARQGWADRLITIS